MSGLIEMNGSRFSIGTVTNDFGAQQFGGKGPFRHCQK